MAWCGSFAPAGAAHDDVLRSEWLLRGAALRLGAGSTGRPVGRQLSPDHDPTSTASSELASGEPTGQGSLSGHHGSTRRDVPPLESFRRISQSCRGRDVVAGDPQPEASWKASRTL
jgi:hypothetical protein